MTKTCGVHPLKSAHLPHFESPPARIAPVPRWNSCCPGRAHATSLRPAVLRQPPSLSPQVLPPRRRRRPGVPPCGSRAKCARQQPVLLDHAAQAAARRAHVGRLGQRPVPRHEPRDGRDRRSVAEVAWRARASRPDARPRGRRSYEANFHNAARRHAELQSASTRRCRGSGSLAIHGRLAAELLPQELPGRMRSDLTPTAASPATKRSTRPRARTRST